MLDRFEFAAYDINGSDSWVPYYMAGEGYLEWIEKFLTKYPHLIDQAWAGNADMDPIEMVIEPPKPDYAWRWFDVVKPGLFVWAPIGLLLMNPVIGGLSIGAFFFAAIARQNGYFKEHKGWTLLEFAAEGGRTDVAMHLLGKGAGLNNNRFMAIATANEQVDFVKTMQDVIKTRGAMQCDRDKLAEMQNLLLKMQGMQGDLEKLKLQIVINGDQSIYFDEFLNLLKQQLQIFDDKAHVFSNDERIDVENKNTRFVNEFKQNYVGKSQAFISHLKVLLNRLENKDSRQFCEQFIAKYEHKLSEFLIANNMENTSQSSAARFGLFFREASSHMFANVDYPFGLTDKKIAFTPGDCFYDAVIANCPDKSWMKRGLRNDVKNTMLNNAAEYRCKMQSQPDGCVEIEIMDWSDSTIVFKSYDSYSHYCEEMAKDGVYIDNLEIIAFTRAKHVCCIVIPQNVDDFCEEEIYGREFINDSNPPIFVGHQREGQGHYVALKTDRPWQKVWDDVLAKVAENKDRAEIVANNRG